MIICSAHIIMNPSWDRLTINCRIILGTKRAWRIEFSTYEHEPVLLFKDHDFLEFPYINPENIQHNMIQNVVDAIHGEAQSISNGISAARTSLVMEKIVYE